MIIGVPRERKTLEKRVALTPNGTLELVKGGHKVLIETHAGAGSFFPDSEYEKAGATIVKTLAEVWGAAELLVKVKEPAPEEYPLMRKGITIFDYLHLAGIPGLEAEFKKSGARGIAYEMVQLDDRRLPLLEPMSEIAGRLGVINGANHLLSQHGGRGILLGGSLGVPPAKVLVCGAGIAGKAAALAAVGLGAEVTVLDIDGKKLDAVRGLTHGAAKTLFSSQGQLEALCPEVDLLIAAVLIPGAHAPRIITTSMVKSMHEGSVIVDISIDQGGCVETIKPTTLAAPTYIEHGVIHYGVTNMPAQTPRTSTIALTSATLPYLLKLANLGIDQAVATIPELKKALV
jgi:alanine dehydrogenase